MEGTELRAGYNTGHAYSRCCVGLDLNLHVNLGLPELE